MIAVLFMRNHSPYKNIMFLTLYKITTMTTVLFIKTTIMIKVLTKISYFCVFIKAAIMIPVLTVMLNDLRFLYKKSMHAFTIMNTIIKEIVKNKLLHNYIVGPTLQPQSTDLLSRGQELWESREYKILYTYTQTHKNQQQ